MYNVILFVLLFQKTNASFNFFLLLKLFNIFYFFYDKNFISVPFF